jgi:hypothetical protein
MDQHGQPLNTGTCFSVSSDDKLVLFLFPGIPTGDPAIVAFYDKRIYSVILGSLENASFYMVYTINWFKKCSILITVLTLYN